MSIRALIAFLVIVAAPLTAQLVAPDHAGIAFGHVHLNVSDIDAQKRFWTLLGGIPVNNERLIMMQFPGLYVVLRKQDPTGGTVGSVVNHFGFYVKNVDEWMPRWKAADLKIEPGNTPKRYYLTAPDNVLVEIIEEPSIPTPIAMHHIHLFVTDPLMVQSWYVKNLGATAGKRTRFDTANVPGAEITLEVPRNEPAAQASTKGRSLDHIGFEVKNLDQFVKKLEEQGTRIEAPGIRVSPESSKLRIARLVDPWGTSIELTEGLVPSPVSPLH